MLLGITREPGHAQPDHPVVPVADQYVIPGRSELVRVGYLRQRGTQMRRATCWTGWVVLMAPPSVVIGNSGGTLVVLAGHLHCRWLPGRLGNDHPEPICRVRARSGERGEG